MVSVVRLRGVCVGKGQVGVLQLEGGMFWALQIERLDADSHPGRATTLWLRKAVTRPLERGRGSELGERLDL